MKKKFNGSAFVIAIVSVFIGVCLTIGILYATGVISAPQSSAGAPAENTTASSYVSHHEESGGHHHSEMNISLDKAKYKGSQAIDYIKSMGEKKLGVHCDFSDEHCHVLVGSNGVKVNGMNCTKVVVAEFEDGFSDDDIIANFYISYDGKTLFKEENGKYIEIK